MKKLTEDAIEWLKKYSGTLEEGRIQGYVHPKTKQEKKHGASKDEDEPKVRSKRSPKNLPSTYDDKPIGTQRSWKKHRRNQYKDKLKETEMLLLKKHAGMLNEEEAQMLAEMAQLGRDMNNIGSFSINMIADEGSWDKTGPEHFERTVSLSNGAELKMGFWANVDEEAGHAIGHYECTLSHNGRDVSTYLNEGFSMGADIIPDEEEYAASSTSIDPATRTTGFSIDRYNLDLDLFLQGDISLDAHLPGVDQMSHKRFHEDVAKALFIPEF